MSGDEKACDKRIIAILVGAMSAIVFLLVMLNWDELLVNGLLLGVVVVFYLCVFPFVTAVLSGACLYQYRQMKQKWACILLPIVAVLSAGLTFILSILILSPSLRMVLILITIVISTCVTFYLCWHYGLPSLLRIIPIFLIVLLLIFIPTFISRMLPYVYTPPVFTANSLPVYNECISFVRGHEEYDDIIIYWGGWVLPKHRVAYNPVADFHGINELRDITKEEYYQLTRDARRLASKLNDIMCYQLQRDNNILLFFKNANHILPSGPGVAYSLNGDNPNELNSDELNAAKSFTHIAGNWYTSKHLVLEGPRRSTRNPTPASLIDHSMQIEGIDPNELHKFD